MTDDPCPLHPERHRPCPDCGVARVRAAMAVMPRHDATETEDDTTRGRAIARARAERRDQP